MAAAAAADAARTCRLWVHDDSGGSGTATQHDLMLNPKLFADLRPGDVVGVFQPLVADAVPPPSPSADDSASNTSGAGAARDAAAQDEDRQGAAQTAAGDGTGSGNGATGDARWRSDTRGREPCHVLLLVPPDSKEALPKGGDIWIHRRVAEPFRLHNLQDVCVYKVCWV